MMTDSTIVSRSYHFTGKRRNTNSSLPTAKGLTYSPCWDSLHNQSGSVFDKSCIICLNYPISKACQLKQTITSMTHK